MKLKELLSDKSTRWTVAALIVVIAFLSSFTYALAFAPGGPAGGGNAPTVASAAVTAAAPVAPGGCCGSSTSAAVPRAPAPGSGQAPAAGGGCCGSGAPAGPATAKAAKVVGGTQRIAVDLSKGYYEPTQVTLKAGVPAEITFGQGSGCLAQVQSADLRFFEDLTSGPRTVMIASPKPGTYAFYCGMEMAFGSIVVR